MNKYTNVGRGALLLMMFVLVLSGCTWQQKLVHEEDYSGYLSHYERIESLEFGTAKRWVSGDLKHYKNLMIEPVQVFPMMALEATQQRDAANYIADYLSQGMNEAARKHGLLTEQAGQGSLKVVPAITGVVTDKQSLRLHQYLLPVAIARVLIQTATDRRPPGSEGVSRD